jgi:hypothetical protein
MIIHAEFNLIRDLDIYEGDENRIHTWGRGAEIEIDIDHIGSYFITGSIDSWNYAIVLGEFLDSIEERDDFLILLNYYLSPSWRRNHDGYFRFPRHVETIRTAFRAELPEEYHSTIESVASSQSAPESQELREGSIPRRMLRM